MRGLVAALSLTQVCGFDLKNLQDPLDALRAETQQHLDQSKAQCEAAHSAFQQEKSRLESSISISLDQAKKAQVQNAKYSQEIKQSQVEMDALEYQSESVRKDLTQAKGQYAQLESRTKELLTELSGAISIADIVCKRINKSLLGVCADMRMGMKSEAQDQEKRLKTAKIEFDKAESNLVSRQKSIKKSVQSVQDMIQSGQESSANARQQLAEFQGSLKVARLDLKTSENAFVAQHRTCDDQQNVLMESLRGIDFFQQQLKEINLKKSGTALFQSNVVASMKRSVVELLQKPDNSPVLQKVVAVLSQTGPFENIIPLIQGAIERLELKTDSLAGHSEQCSKHLADNEMARVTAAANVLQFRRRYQETSSNLDESQDYINKGMQVVTDETKTLSVAVQNRNNDALENENVLLENKKIQSVLTEGIRVLREKGFDKSNAGAVFSAAATILTDARKVTSLTQQAEVDQRQHLEHMKVSAKKKIEDANASIEKHRMKIVEDEHSLENIQEHHAASLSQLQSSLEEFRGLKSQCLTSGEDFAERESKRQHEISSLKAALDALS